MHLGALAERACHTRRTQLLRQLRVHGDHVCLIGIQAPDDLPQRDAQVSSVIPQCAHCSEEHGDATLSTMSLLAKRLLKGSVCFSLGDCDRQR